VTGRSTVKYLSSNPNLRDRLFLLFIVALVRYRNSEVRTAQSTFVKPVYGSVLILT
jgi:hypothetical protein